MPAVWPTNDGMVARQLLFTVADITSKLIFGVVLGRVARLRSKELGYLPAIEVDGEAPARRTEYRTGSAANAP